MNTDIAASWANLGLLRRPAAAFFVAVGGALASLGLFSCLEDGRARDATVGTVHMRLATRRRQPHAGCLLIFCFSLVLFYLMLTSPASEYDHFDFREESLKVSLLFRGVCRLQNDTSFSSHKQAHYAHYKLHKVFR